MPVARDLMTAEVLTVPETAPVSQAAQLLSSRRITGLPVVNGEGAVLGILSELDLISKRGKTAGEIMSKHVISASPDTAVESLARLMASERIRRIPIIEGGRLVGIVTRADLVRFLATHHWACPTCGHYERGLEPPPRCDQCGAAREQFLLQQAPTGM